MYISDVQRYSDDRERKVNVLSDGSFGEKKKRAKLETVKIANCLEFVVARSSIH